MKWKEIEVGQFVLYTTSSDMLWISKISSKEEQSFVMEDYMYNHKDIVASASTGSFRYSEIANWKILKVCDKFPKEFLI